MERERAASLQTAHATMDSTTESYMIVICAINN